MIMLILVDGFLDRFTVDSDKLVGKDKRCEIETDFPENDVEVFASEDYSSYSSKQ